MTDKEKKELNDGVISIFKRFNILDHRATIGGLRDDILKLIDSMQLEEIPPKFPLISKKKCMFTKDSYTDEDRKVLCEDCKEKCEFNKEEPVSEECIYNRTLEERQKSCKFCSAACQVRIKEEPVSDKLEEAAEDYAATGEILANGKEMISFDEEKAFKAGAKWHKANLWKHADGDELPIINREVIALLDNGKVVFAHRPPEFWDGKDIITGKVTRNYPKTYDKGGWNIPDVKFWLNVELPKEIEL